MIAKQNSMNRLVHDPHAGDQHQPGFYKRRERLDLAMSVVVLVVGGTICGLNRKESDGGRNEVDTRVRRFRKHAERTCK